MPGGTNWGYLEAMLKRAGRIYSNDRGEPQWRLVVACEPELAERGYDACRVKGQQIMGDEDVREADGGLRYDAAPEAVVQQIQSIIKRPGSRSSMPPAMLADSVGDAPMVEDTADGKSVRIVGRHMHTEQEVRDQAGLSREQWECVAFEVSDHNVAMKGDGDQPDRVMVLPRTFARFRPREEYDALADFRESILADIEARAPLFPALPDPEPSADPHLLEFSPFDLHVGKLAWEPETGENYDSKIARDLLVDATEDVLAKVRGFPVHRVLFPVGNDLFHTDTLEQTTTRGTRQDTDSRPDLMHDRTERLLVEVVDRLAALAPVKIITIPGNHDRQTAQWMGRVLRAYYRNTDRVEVDCGPSLRKYERWGPALLGFTHGDQEKHRDLPLIMATEAATDWATCTQREFHVGHFHRSKETVFNAGDSFNGVRVRVLPSLSGTDAWHHAQGYVKSWRAVESYLWSRQTGYVGHFSSNVVDGRIARAA